MSAINLASALSERGLEREGAASAVAEGCDGRCDTAAYSSSTLQASLQRRLEEESRTSVAENDQGWSRPYLCSSGSDGCAASAENSSAVRFL